MLASTTEKPFTNADWLFEIKWDGYRMLSFIQNKEAQLISRNLLPYNAIFPEVLEALQELDFNCVLDGEVVALNDKGLPDFQKLQNVRKKVEKARLIYYVFDLLWLEGKDLKELPLIDRKSIVQSILPQNHDIIKFSDHIINRGEEFFEIAMKQDLEGIMAKKTDSTYAKGFRTKNWLKIKNNSHLNAIICGYTKPRNSRKMFGALILGKYNNETLEYIGHTGTGFNDVSLKELYNTMQPLVTDIHPFSKKPKTNMPATWIKP